MPISRGRSVKTVEVLIPLRRTGAAGCDNRHPPRRLGAAPHTTPPQHHRDRVGELVQIRPRIAVVDHRVGRRSRLETASPRYARARPRRRRQRRFGPHPGGRHRADLGVRSRRAASESVPASTRHPGFRRGRRQRAVRARPAQEPASVWDCPAGRAPRSAGPRSARQRGCQRVPAAIRAAAPGPGTCRAPGSPRPPRPPPPARRVLGVHRDAAAAAWTSRTTVSQHDRDRDGTRPRCASPR